MDHPGSPVDAVVPATTEQVWFVQATYAPDAAEARVPIRPEHLAGVARRVSGMKGCFKESAFTDVSESVLLVRAASEAEALAIVGDDVYLRSGVWVELRARPFGRVVIPDDARS